MIYADLIDEGGIQCKMLLNDMMAESKSLAVQGKSPSSIDLFQVKSRSELALAS